MSQKPTIAERMHRASGGPPRVLSDAEQDAVRWDFARQISGGWPLEAERLFAILCGDPITNVDRRALTPELARAAAGVRK